REEKSKRSKKDKKKKAHRRRKIVSSVKPIPPEKYDGVADINKFNQFINQVTNYLEDGNVELRRHVHVVSSFLTGKAFKYYSREATKHSRGWKLDDFLNGLFNYCFPLDFRNKQRNRLRDFGQGKATVQDYVSELEDMFIYVGEISKRDRIIKMFAGFRPSIKRGLYLAKLDPEVAKWGAIVREAEYLERAEKVDIDEHRHDHVSGKSAKAYHEKRHNGGGESSSKHDKHRDNTSKPQPSSQKRNEDNDKSRTGASDNKPSHTKRSKFDKTKSDGKRERTPKLSPEKVAEYKAENRCFNCGEVGHFGRNCQSGKTAKASGSRPPGIQSNSIRFDIREMEDLRARALGHSDDSLTLNAIGEDVIMSEPEFLQGSSRDHAHDEVDSDASSIHSSDLDQVQLFDSMTSESSATEVDSDDDSLPDLQPNPDSEDEDDDGDTEAGDMGVPTEVVSDNGATMGNLRRRSETWTTMSFGRDTVIVGPPREYMPNDEAVEHTPEWKLDWLDRLSRRSKSARNLTDHIHRMVEYLLESMQPYPGDPSNCLQYRGWRFGTTELEPGLLGVWDNVRGLMFEISRIDVIRGAKVGLFGMHNACWDGAHLILTQEGKGGLTDGIDSIYIERAGGAGSGNKWKVEAIVPRTDCVVLLYSGEGASQSDTPCAPPSRGGVRVASEPKPPSSKASPSAFPSLRRASSSASFVPSLGSNRLNLRALKSPATATPPSVSSL
ncbi:hypothetical protein H0H92_000715, partial [Tricholoma furcatifolium]